jgi:coenzyme F420 hydrogenase subunit beta
MTLDGAGFERPARRSWTAEATDAAVARRFRDVCPGVTVAAPERPAESRRDPVIGTYLRVWEAWATDPEIRYRGSSGGALTALVSWLVGHGIDLVAASADSSRPTRTVPVRITSEEEAAESAGSRYAPTCIAAHPALRSAGAVVGKPCESAAIRSLGAPRSGEGPLLLSFFCAGTPSQAATEGLVKDLGGEDDVVTEMWYRGRGWPGRFSVVTARGTESLSYDESWGKRLGPAVQWRCKICPDGVGELSDVTAGDFWQADERGYPVFEEDDGRSALVARTPRGLALVEEAIAAGVIEAAPVDMRRVALVQPYQRQRRALLLGRLLGSRLAGRSVPRYRGFGLFGFAVRDPRGTWRAMRGARGRIRRIHRVPVDRRLRPDESLPSDASSG